MACSVSCAWMLCDILRPVSNVTPISAKTTHPTKFVFILIARQNLLFSANFFSQQSLIAEHLESIFSCNSLLTSTTRILSVNNTYESQRLQVMYSLRLIIGQIWFQPQHHNVWYWQAFSSSYFNTEHITWNLTSPVLLKLVEKDVRSNYCVFNRCPAV